MVKVVKGKNKTFLVFSLAIALVLLGFAGACTGVGCGECVPQTYDSDYICMNTGIDSATKLSTYVTQLSGDAWYYETSPNTVCGTGFYYIDTNTGVLKLKTPSLPFSGEYTFKFYYGIGTSNDIGTEDFSVKCGDETYTFLDNDDSGDDIEFRFGEVSCDFDSGYNYVEFKSLDTGSVHLKKFRITGELECPPEPPVCGNGAKETGEECDDGNLENGDGCSANCKIEEDEDKENTCSETKPVQYCDINWKCTGWSECSDSVMTRDCYDTNYCDEEYNKPFERTGCSELSKVYVEENNALYFWIIAGVILFVILVIMLVNLFK